MGIQAAADDHHGSDQAGGQEDAPVDHSACMAVVAQSLVAGNAEGVFQIGVIYLFWPFFRFARALAPFHPARIAYEQQKKYV